MSHLHIPDGILPVWLWVSGLALAAFLVLLALWMVRGVDLKRKVPLLGMMSAMMLVSMNIEIAPYHLNLSVITGIILGPWMAVIAALIVNVVMALVGHGGITVAGINSSVLALEAVMGYSFFRMMNRVVSPGLAAGISTVMALFISTCIMLGVVFLANVDFSSASIGEMHEVLQSPAIGTLTRTLGVRDGFNFRFFAAAAFSLGFFGWMIEAVITGIAVKFISKVKPELIR
ncbi:MAG TPA: energy-coupling factor ABC transporter permease [Nitrospirota bacterium]|jgi:cobalt/nickel transport system permease protein